jgi:SET family sugar efflux transporter-like MFS transporter
LLLTPPFRGLLVTTFVLGLTGAFMAPFGALWATQEIGMSSGMLGAFMTINAASAIVVSSVVARRSDTHVPRRALLLVGAAAGALGALGYAAVREPVLLILIGSSALALASINFAQLFAHAREELAREPSADIPFSLGVLRACFALAWVVGPNLGAAIKLRFGYAGLFAAAAGFFAILLGCVLLFVVARPRQASPSALGVDTLAALRRPGVLAHCAAFGLLFAAFTLNSLNLPLVITKQLGGTERSVGAAFAIAPLFELSFMLGFGHLVSRGHAKVVILLGGTAAIVYFAALYLVSAPWQVYPLQVLLAAGVAVTASVAIPVIQELLPGQPGVATNLYSNALKLGGLLGFSAFGLLTGHVGHSGLFLVCAGLGVCSVSLLGLASLSRSRTA